MLPTALRRSGALARVFIRHRALAAPVLALVASAGSAGVADAATRYVGGTGKDSGSCTGAAPCASFGYAYRQAAPGDVVLVAGGAYGKQLIPRVAGRTAPAVEFRPAGDGPVTVSDIDIAGDYTTVRDVASAGYWDVDAGDEGASQVTGVTIVNGSGPGLWIWAARNLLVKGGDYGPSVDIPTAQIAADPPSYGVTFDGATLHDARVTNSTVHTECLWAGGVQGLTVRNGLFYGCTYFDIFFTTLNGPDPANVLLENTVFESTVSWDGSPQSYALNVANWVTTADTFRFRNNTLDGDILVQSATIRNFAITGNTGSVRSCWDGVTYAFNVFNSSSCGASDRQSPATSSQYVNPRAHDWRLKAGAPAIDTGNAADSPATDRDGKLRDSRPDAGAYEYAGAVPTPTATPTVTPAPTATATATPDTQAPSVPQAMAWTTRSETSIGLRWNASTDNRGVAGYRIYRNNVAIATTRSLSLGVTGLACGTSYTIGLTAFDAAGNESNRAYATGTTSTSACAVIPTPTRDPSRTPTPTPTASAAPAAAPAPAPDAVVAASLADPPAALDSQPTARPLASAAVVARKGCRQCARLRLTVAQPTRIAARIERAGRTVRVAFRRRLGVGRYRVSFSTKGLQPGRYKLVLTAANGQTIRLKLTVRARE